MRGVPPHAGPYAVFAQFRGGSEVGRVGVSAPDTAVEVGSLPRVGGCGVRGKRDEGEAVHGRA